MRPVLSILFILVFICCDAQAPVFKNYTPDDGLSGSEVYWVIEDTKGYIWFGTDAGVSRFDGNNFRRFTINDGLPDNTIFRIYEDKKGRIWFQSFSGRFSYLEDDSIQEFVLPETFTALITGVITQTFAIDEHNNLWIGTANAVYKVDSNKTVTTYPLLSTGFNVKLLNSNIIGAFKSNMVDPNNYINNECP